MEAYFASITKIDNLNLRQWVSSTFVASQGDKKSVEKYVNKIEIEKESEKGAFDAERLLSDLGGMRKL